MKNNWLDNYNDSKTSAPEGFQGEGYSIIGRNYSPAWGGQFQMGGNVYPVNYVPKAQIGMPINPILPFASTVANKFNDWFGDDEPVNKPKPVAVAKKKSTDRMIDIVDPRKKMMTTNQPLRPKSDVVTDKYNSHHLDKLIQEAKRQGLSRKDIENLSAMGFQETKWGRTDPNIGHVRGQDWGGHDSYSDFVNAYKIKMKLADDLGIKDPIMRLQVYNGTGPIYPTTENKYHGFNMQKIYGVPIPKEGISMKKNPLYGKQITDIRDNVLAKNPGYVRYMDSIYKAPLPKYMQKEAAMDMQKHLVLPSLSKKAMGGTIAGAPGFTYARTNDPAPDNGPGAKKTMASAKNGDIIKSQRGQWDYPGQVTEIDQSKEGSYIDMGPDPETGKPITQNILAVSNTGDVKLLSPGGKYKLQGTKVTEYPIAQEGKIVPKGKEFLDQLKADSAARKNKVDIRETPRTAVNDVIPNASKMAAKADAAREKDIKYGEKVKRDQDKAQVEAQKKFNALSKEEQERVLYDQYNQEHGTISQYEPDSKLSKFAQSMVTPFTALTDLYQNGEVRDNLLKSVINNPKTANAYDAAYLGTLGYAAAPYVSAGANYVGSVVAPYMAADATIGGTTLTGVNMNNLLNAGFATHGLTHIAPNAAKWVEDPSWENAGEVGMNALEIAPIVGPAMKGTVEGLGYLGSKGKQAMNAIKESTPYIAFNENAQNKLLTRLNELRDERKALQAGPHNKEMDDALNRLADEEFNILNKMRNRRPYEHVGDQALINIKQRKLDKANMFTLTDEGLYQSKMDHPLGFKQGSSEIIDLETGEKFPISVKGSGVESTQKLNEEGKVVRTITGGSEPTMNDDYIRVLNKNIDYIEKNLPGSKVYGSTRTAGELGVPHVTGEVVTPYNSHEVGDYDIYMTQADYENKFGKRPNVNYDHAQNHSAPGEHGKDLQMQVNVIAQNSEGKATGQRAVELFRQWEPDEFFNAAKEAMKKGKNSEIEIPYTPQELIDKVNPTVKTVMDAYEAHKAAKNINKIDGIINYGNPDVVLEGQRKFVHGILGSKGNIGYQFDPSHFADVDENMKILKDIHFIGNPARVARDPKRMQIALNDFYINNSIISRQVNNIPLEDIETVESALGTYDPNAPGGSYNGIGQNNTTLGDVGHLNNQIDDLGQRHVTGVKQYGFNLDTSSPRAYVDSIKHTTSGSKLFTQEEKDILHEIVEKYKNVGDMQYYTPGSANNTTELVKNLPKSDEAKALMYEFAQRTGRRLNIQEGNVYSGGSTYVSALSDFDDAIDTMTYTYADHYDFDKALKSFAKRVQQSKMTSSQKINTLSDELLPKEFKEIEGYLKGGKEKAKERISKAYDELSKLNEQKHEFAKRAANKKLGNLRTQIEAKEKAYRDEIKSLNDNMREIDARLAKVNNFRHVTNEVAKGIAMGVIISGVGALGYLEGKKMAEREERKAKRQEEELTKKFNKLSPDDQYNWKNNYEFERERLQDIQKDPFMKGVLGHGVKQQYLPDELKQNGGKITKAKDGNQLVKLNQLTNFTNYNTKQPGGWLDKYN